MGLPSQKRTKSSARRRASHFAIKTKKLAKCPKCGKEVLPHVACKFCGTYKGKQIITLKTKKKNERQKAKERKQAEREKETSKSKK